MSKTIEKKIRFNAVLIYIIVALICMGMILYVYSFSSNITVRKKHIEQYHQVFALTNELIYTVNQAQSEANLYVVSGQLKHFRLFRRYVNHVQQQADSLTVLTEQTAPYDILYEVVTLLDEKGQVVMALNKQFDHFNPFEPLAEQLQRIDSTILADSLLIITTMKDTIINPPVKKNFWRRFSEVFSPDKTVDTMVTVTTSKMDTLKMLSTNRLRLITEISGFAEQAGKNYTDRMAAIERQINQLVTADQELSLQISNLLIRLHRQTIDTNLEEIRKNEKLIRRNYMFSILAGVVALALILVFIVLIIKDVNKGYTVRKKLEQADKRNKQIMESRHKLLLTVSHDIKTPLNSTMGYLELWQNGALPSQREVVSMQNSGKHILALLENVLKFSSLEQGTLQVVRRNFNLREITVETADMFVPLARQKGLDFECKIAIDPHAIIRSDSLKIKQIITNLLSNAVKYTSAGNIRFIASLDKNTFHFSVRDTGVGIPEQQMDSVFKPFTRVENSSTMAEGSGFGMYVVKGLLDLLKGTIEVASVEGTGTAIQVAIPVEKIATETTFVPKNIIVVDDDESLLAVIESMLLKLGHTVTVCNTQTQFERCMHHLSDYNTVLTDMEMGTFSGEDILKRVQATKACIPVVIMTGRSDFDERKATRMGFSDYLAKPVTMSALAQSVGGVVPITPGPVSLEEMFDGDEEAVRAVLQTFITATGEHVTALREALSTNDYKKAQALCHKMLPMFMQVGAEDAAVILKKVDASREHGEYDGWGKEVSEIIEKALSVTDRIRTGYFNGS